MIKALSELFLLGSVCLVVLLIDKEIEASSFTLLAVDCSLEGIE